MFDRFKAALKKLIEKKIDCGELPPELIKNPYFPGMLSMVVACTVAIKIFEIRERRIAELPIHIQKRIRRSDKRWDKLWHRRKRPILRHAMIKIRRSRVL